MKAQILKIAGVKNEKEFYKKFPTEEAFMKKHGKELKKAQGGAFVPTDPVIDSSYQIPFDEQSVGETGNFAFGTPSDLIPELNPKNKLKVPSKFARNAKDAAMKAAGQLAPQLGSIIGNIEQIEQNKRDIKKANQWADISKVVSQAALSRPEQPRRRYVRPEDNLVTAANPLGKRDSLLAAQNGAEIQNTFAPNTIYTDMGYEPLNDSNPKQYVHGGQLHKAGFGNTLKSINTGPNAINLNQFSGIAGGIGGMLGSAAGKGTGRGGAGSAIGSTALGAIGNALLPGVGGLLGSSVGGFVGGLFDANDQNQLQQAEDRQTTAIGEAVVGLGTSNLHKANRGFMYNGGYMNPEYNPQVIAKFGDYSMDQLLAPPHDADMLRAGGHLKEYTPPSERAMYTGRNQMEYGGQMAMGGDLQVHRGQAETMSYNPFLPDGGETVMFRGPSHDNGGMPISYGQNGVEVEGGEPAVKLQDGGSPDGNLVVYGNMIIPNYGVAELGDKNAKGKKFKHYVADLSKIEAKQGKLIEKTTALINNTDANDQFDKLSLNTGQANLIGATMKLKNIAEKKKTAATVQNAILDTAKEMGLESDQLAKGKIKYAKANDPYAEFGAKLQKGGKVKKTYDPEFENFIDQAMMLEQANSSQQVTPSERKSPIGGVYRGGAYNYGTGNKDDGAHNTRAKAKEFYYKNYWSKVKDLPPGLRTRALQLAINTGDPYGELMVAAGKMSVADRAATKGERKDKAITGNKDWEANKKVILDEYNKDPQAFLGKLDAEQDRYYDSIVANNDFGVDPTTVREFFDDYVGLAKYASQQYIPKPGVAAAAAKSTMPTNAPKAASISAKTPKGAAAKATTRPIVPTSGNDTFSFDNRELIPQFIPELRNSSYLSGVPMGASDDLSEYDLRSSLMPDVYSPVSGITPSGSPKDIAEAMRRMEQQQAENSSLNQLMLMSDSPSQSKMVERGDLEDVQVVTPRLKPEPAPVPPIVQALASKVVPPVDKVKETKVKKEKGKFPWDMLLTGANSMLPFLRPSNQIPLDPSQLSGELYALSQNQEEPVFAQSYQPMLSQGINISLQDQLNEITSQARSAERMAQGNPAALAMIASQAADAKNKILGEQFRLNQGEAQRVAETNRQTINEAAKTNIGLFDQQQQRQAQARSNTKMQNIVALNSINDKILKQKAENRQMGVMENMYNYRFSPSGVAYNMNPLAQFNVTGSGKNEDGVAPAGYEFYKAMRKKGTTKDDESVVSRNGSIVKAIKGL